MVLLHRLFFQLVIPNSSIKRLRDHFLLKVSQIDRNESAVHWLERCNQIEIPQFSSRLGKCFLVNVASK